MSNGLENPLHGAVGDVTRTQVIKIDPGATLRDVAVELASSGVGFAIVDDGLPVIEMSLAPIRLISGSMVTTSSVSPENDTASTRSCAVIMPRSP